MTVKTHMPVKHDGTRWWKDAVVYQIYPASFYDSNNDGVGDLPGVALKLDYLQQLGVDTIWLSPVYKSPQVDMGYDISDYCDIHAPYGTMADMDDLIASVAARNMKIVMDLVVNHTSDQHEWFRQSRMSKDNPFRDWYIWRPGRMVNGVRCPPNNWRGMFGGSVWQYDPQTGEYYLHCFAVEQPDLNWENPAVVSAVHDLMRFWLDKGVNGFRCDVINFISKAPGYPDAPVTEPGAPFQDASALFANGPRLHEHLNGVGKLLESYDAFSVGEMPFAKDEKEVLRVVSPQSRELNMIFQFDVVDMDHGAGGKFSPRAWTLPQMKGIVSKWQTLMHASGGWNAVFAENHDQSRTVSRYTSDAPEHRSHAAKMLATWLACLGGTLFVYQGQELGMKNAPKEWSVAEYKDIETQNFWAELLATSPTPELVQQTMAEVQLKARDHARTPVQWADAPHGGFSTVEPWMRANPDYAVCNAAAQTADADSVFRYWAGMLALRREYRHVLVYGSFQLLDEDHPAVFAYERRSQRVRIVVVLNWSGEQVDWRAERGLPLDRGVLLRSNYARDALCVVDGAVRLSPWEAAVVLEEDCAL